MTTTNRTVVIAAVVLAVAGCGPTDKNHDGIADGTQNPTKVTLNASSTPTGSISGQVLDADQKPLSGAAVTAITGQGSPQTTTDANGMWSFKNLPANSGVTVVITKSGFATLRAPVEVPGDAGGQPVSNGNGFAGRWIILPLSGSLKFQVFAADGVPAAGAKAVLTVSPTAMLLQNLGIIPSPNGVPVVVSATADSSGVLSFSGIPDPADIYRLAGLFGSSRYQLTVAALDENGDGIPDSAGLTRSYQAYNLYLANASTVLTMQPAQSSGGVPFYLASSTVRSLIDGSGSPPQLNLLKPTDNTVTLVFTHQLQPGSLLVRVTDEYGQPVAPAGAGQVPGQVATQASGQVVTVTLPPGLSQGHEYNLTAHAVSLQTGAQVDTTGYFFVADLTAAVPLNVAKVVFHDGSNGFPVDGKLNPGENVDVLFNQPVGYYGWLVWWGGPIGVAYFNYDLDGSGTIGDAYGEKGYAYGGFDFYPNEPISDPAPNAPLFTLTPSNYTTRWSLTYPWWLYGWYANLPPTAEVDIDFTTWQDPTAGVQTLWGSPLQNLQTQTLSITTP